MASAIPKRPNDRGIEKPTHATRLEFYYIHMVVHKYTIPIHRVPYCHYSTVRYAWSISNFKAILVQPAGTLVSNLCRYISNISLLQGSEVKVGTYGSCWVVHDFALWNPRKAIKLKLILVLYLKNNNKIIWVFKLVIVFIAALENSSTNLIMEWYFSQLHIHENPKWGPTRANYLQESWPS